MFGDLWPGFDPEDVPITSITNGVHAPTWTDPALLGLAESTLGTADTEHADWASGALSDAEFWGVKRRMRLQLVEDARRRLAAAWSDQHAGAAAPPWVSRVLDPDTLTVGFARRVPTYKRLTLMLSDPERLKAILTNPERPVQFVIAGKSHPADDEGKRLIQQLVQFAQQPELRERIVFLPDYDMGMAELLYPGCDVWLNNPLRPLEACGTSGMKAAMNGALNLSILDGWWAEYAGDDYGYAPRRAGARDRARPRAAHVRRAVRRARPDLDGDRRQPDPHPQRHHRRDLDPRLARRRGVLPDLRLRLPDVVAGQGRRPRHGRSSCRIARTRRCASSSAASPTARCASTIRRGRWPKTSGCALERGIEAARRR